MNEHGAGAADIFKAQVSQSAPQGAGPDDIFPAEHSALYGVLDAARIVRNLHHPIFPYRLPHADGNWVMAEFQPHHLQKPLSGSFVNGEPLGDAVGRVELWDGAAHLVGFKYLPGRMNFYTGFGSARGYAKMCTVSFSQAPLYLTSAYLFCVRGAQAVSDLQRALGVQGRSSQGLVQRVLGLIKVSGQYESSELGERHYITMEDETAVGFFDGEGIARYFTHPSLRRPPVVTVVAYQDERIDEPSFSVHIVRPSMASRSFESDPFFPLAPRLVTELWEPTTELVRSPISQ